MWPSRKEIRVLVLDHCPAARQAIGRLLAREEGIAVVGEAADGALALTRVRELKPDVVVMDIETPVMGGLESMETICREHPVPILALTSLAGVQSAFAAVSRGAADVMEKGGLPENGENLVRKIRLLANVDVKAQREAMGRLKARDDAGRPAPRRRPSGERVVAIAASTGGPQAIRQILSQLPETFPAPILLTQHIADSFALGLAAWLNDATRLAVSQAANGDRLAPGRVFLNPPRHAMRVTRQGVILLAEQDRRLVYNPCCDTMLRAVAEAYGERAIGVILTGMGEDGVLGMESIRNAGGATLAQDAGSSVIFGMNGMAVRRGFVDRSLPLAEIAAELVALSSR